MQEIALTQGKVAIVDDEDYPVLVKYSWCTHIGRDNCGISKRLYAVRRLLNWEGRGTGHTTMHETLLNPPQGFVVDHINGNGLDNRRENLRMVTHRENMQNIVHRKKTSKYPGVRRRSDRKKWTAQIHLNGKQRYLGSFVEEVDAATAYRVACVVLGV